MGHYSAYQTRVLATKVFHSISGHAKHHEQRSWGPSYGPPNTLGSRSVLTLHGPGFQLTWKSWMLLRQDSQVQSATGSSRHECRGPSEYERPGRVEEDKRGTEAQSGWSAGEETKRRHSLLRSRPLTHMPASCNIRILHFTFTYFHLPSL